MLEELFSPRSIAVVGVSREKGKVGHAVFDNLLAGGFDGPVYPVNPSAVQVHGRRCYASVADLPTPVDLAVVVVPAAAAPSVIEECGQAGIKAAVVISAGFRETGPEGAALERQLVEACRAHRIRLLGPNCLGVISTESGLNASFAPIMPAPGWVSFMSQSGALGTAILDWAAGEGIGLAHFVSLGNKADLSEVDLVHAWSASPATRVVVAYLEGIADGRGFVESVRALTAHTPFIALTAGSSDAGARAVSSHTGSLASSRAVYDAAFRAAGAIAATTVEELFDYAEGFARQPLPEGPGTVILTNAGGPAILATDACQEHGITLASLEPQTVTALRAVLPAAAALYNPVDILGDADPERYATAAEIILRDPGVHSLIVILTPQAMTDAAQTAREVVHVARASEVTTLAVFMGDARVAEGVHILQAGGVPHYAFPERSVATLAAMERQRRRLAEPAAAPVAVAGDRDAVRELIDHARAAGRTFITEASAQRIAAAYGLTVPCGGIAPDLEAARALAKEIGYPVVLKIASPDILHKSDIGGIALDLGSQAELDDAYERIMLRVHQRMSEARVWGVTVQQQLPPGREVIIGVNRDPSFGPMLMFGLGGIYVEVLQDVTFRLCPVTPAEAHRMITEIRSFGLLRGARGQTMADLEAVADAIVRVSALAMDFDEITELDVNPLIVGDRGQGAVAADIRIGIGG